MRNRLWLLASLSLSVGCHEGGGKTVVVDAGPTDSGGKDTAVVEDTGGTDEPDIAIEPDVAVDLDTGSDDTEAPDVTDAGDTAGPTLTDEQKAINGVTVTGTWTIPGLQHEATVVRTQMGVPHLYAKTLPDLGRIAGFTVARDRFFIMDLVRRLGTGTISELLGDAGLENDLDARMFGTAAVSDRIEQHLPDDIRAYFEGVAEGVNAYIAEVAAGKLPPPSELAIAGPLLGKPTPAELMKAFTVRDIAAMLAVLMYQTNFEGDDVGREAKFRSLDTLFDGVANAELRRTGFISDVWNDNRPLFPGSGSTAGFGTYGVSNKPGALPAPTEAISGAQERPIPQYMLDDMAKTVAKYRKRFGEDGVAAFGSNAWAANSTVTKDGSAILAGDGHLSLTIPALTYQIGFDTRTFGDPNGLRQVGLLLSPLPMLTIGTNGEVAWSATNPVMDITDWYREELQVGPDGPTSSRFQGEWKPVVKRDETYVINDVPALGSVGRTVTWPRYETFDGRFITQIEGKTIASPDDALPGETVVRLKSGFVVPGDTDNDGTITAISFVHVALDATGLAGAVADLGSGKTVYDVRNAMKKFVGGGLLFAASDSAGNILYSAYQAIPCRKYLEQQNGAWVPGADPTRLLDGTVYGAFHLPTQPDGAIDEVPGQTDPYKCAVPFDQVPQAVNPPDGYVFTANNDPATLTDDGNAYNDAWYLGGPWYDIRANTIARSLKEAKENGGIDVDTMQRIQANHTSRYGETFVPYLLASLDSAAALPDTATGADGRRRATYQANKARFDAVRVRLQGWAGRGYQAESGVDTFYEAPTAEQKEDAIATMIANAWMPRFVSQVWGDEPVNAFRYSDSRERAATLSRFLAARGKADATAPKSTEPTTGESVFFDRLGTPEVESSDELMLTALAAGLDFLESPPTAPGSGGFGTADMTQWLWGLRHVTKFESLIGSYLDGGSSFSAITDLFSITTSQVPLAANLPAGDPRKDLKWFPRHSDNDCVDAANPGWSGTDFSNGSGAVMRMVVRMKGEEFEGADVIPGGQSGLNDSEHFADQVKLWLANEALPMHLKPKDVAKDAVGREVFTAP